MIEYGADAIIASDGGIIDMIKQYAPNIQIHISTQANTVSLHSANFWKKLGAKRIILARELSKEEIKYILDNRDKDLEFEMFCHGAICYAYSGRCYLSKYLSNRCANLGDCSQSCRWEYKLFAREVNNKESVIEIDTDEKGTYIFSSKDMCLINQISTIIEMGMDSLKIEGRLKTDYYLATVVRAYRRAIDDYYNLTDKSKWDSSSYLNELLKVKTRGLSEFYFTDSNNQDIHDYDGMSENLEYEYAGKVIATNDNLDVIEIKNKLSVGDSLEVLFPDDMKIYEFKIDKLFDINTSESIGTINPGIKGQKVKMKIPFEVKQGYVLRRKKGV